MKLIKTEIKEVNIIEIDVFGDHRGWFTETYSKEKFKDIGINNDFIQDNQSFSAEKGTLRGLHFQLNPKAQTKLVRCTKGSILDVAVDIRKGSPTYKKWVAIELTAENKKQLLIPKGFAHGFLTLTDDVEVQYKVDEYYSPECDRSIKFDDPEICIDWGIEDPIISEKDKKAPLLKDSDTDFKYTVLVTGVNGQLGHDVVKELKKTSIKVLSPSKEEFDITNKQQVLTYIKSMNPDVIIHCAAYTSVDKAEEEKELCYDINVKGTANIVEAAKYGNSKIVYVSTDYVFDGSGQNPHLENEKTNPINYYGYSKAQGEEVIKNNLENYFIIRTSWVYGINGNNFVKTMLRLSKSKNEINIIEDQVGSPTYTKDLAKFINELIQTSNYGIYHGVNEGYCSWYDFAKEIFKISNIDIKINPIKTSEYLTSAKRPLNSKLSKENINKIGINRLPKWDDALRRYLNEVSNN